jgi:hypothetical protein
MGVALSVVDSLEFVIARGGSVQVLDVWGRVIDRCRVDPDDAPAVHLVTRPEFESGDALPVDRHEVEAVLGTGRLVECAAVTARQQRLPAVLGEEVAGGREVCVAAGPASRWPGVPGLPREASRSPGPPFRVNVGHEPRSHRVSSEPRSGGGAEPAPACLLVGQT